MAYNESLARRVQAVLDGRPGLTVRKMFGGISFLANGNLAVGVMGEDLLVRTGVINHEEQYKLPHTKEMVQAGRTARGMLLVEPAGTGSDRDLRAWIEKGWSFATALPAK